MLVFYASGHEQAKELVNYTLKTLDVPVETLFSTLGRTTARTLETNIYIDAMQDMFNDLVAKIKAGDTKTVNELCWEPSSWQREARGVGCMEAPRCALAHWVVITDGSSTTIRPSFPAPETRAQRSVGSTRTL